MSICFFSTLFVSQMTVELFLNLCRRKKKLSKNSFPHLFLSFPDNVTTLVSYSFEHCNKKAIPQPRANRGEPLEECIITMCEKKSNSSVSNCFFSTLFCFTNDKQLFNRNKSESRNKWQYLCH